MRTMIYWGSVIFIILAGHKFSGGRFDSFVGLRPASIVLLPVLCYFSYIFGWRGLKQFLRRIFKQKLTSKDAQIIDRGCSLGFLMGWIGSFIGILHVMANLKDSEPLTAAISLTFISLLYGSLPALMLLPICPAIAEKRTTHKAAGYSVAASIIMAGTLLYILYASGQ